MVKETVVAVRAATDASGIDPSPQGTAIMYPGSVDETSTAGVTIETATFVEFPAMLEGGTKVLVIRAFGALHGAPGGQGAQVAAELMTMVG